MVHLAWELQYCMGVANLSNIPREQPPSVQTFLDRLAPGHGFVVQPQISRGRRLEAR
jgi:hypothetical protein